LSSKFTHIKKFFVLKNTPIVDNFIITAAAAATCLALFCLFWHYLCTFFIFAYFLQKSYPQLLCQRQSKTTNYYWL